MSESKIGIRNKAYEDKSRELKEHEKIMLSLFRDYMGERTFDILDIGCADGMFLQHMSHEVHCGNIIGIDNDEVLVDTANGRNYDADNHLFYFDEIEKIIDNSHEINKMKFDAVLASGIFPCINDVEGLVGVLSNLLNVNGCIFIFGSNLSNPVDLQYAIRPEGETEWQCQRTVLSIGNLKRILEKNFDILEVKDFEIPFDLPESDNICSTYSVETIEGQRLILTRFNVLTEIRFIVARKK